MILCRFLVKKVSFLGVCLAVASVSQAQVFVEGLKTQGRAQIPGVSVFAGGEAAIDLIQNGIREAALSCGLEVLDGGDDRLPSAVQSRNADEVFAKVDGKTAQVYGLVKWEAENFRNGLESGAVLKFMKRNGGKILYAALNYEFGDVEVNTSPGGNVAYTRSSRVNHKVRTEYRVRGSGGGMRRVSAEDFVGFLQEKVVKVYGERICKGQYK